ncbi:hypothetical protein [Streptomyces sp. RKAG337]|uniref:hypothetical protein n=1 Tax=Streptomyces sp. RKAG337 TaxID=2893404 RepID=UPI0020343469|nr:hypothetical protein [Streptomyces sp. RKAG337]MCM2431035.1 hypothetical protein [Streptomyces sp. RKAG337]
MKHPPCTAPTLVPAPTSAGVHRPAHTDAAPAPAGGLPPLDVRESDVPLTAGALDSFFGDDGP